VEGGAVWRKIEALGARSMRRTILGLNNRGVNGSRNFVIDAGSVVK
jgi:hypothetical protein